MKDNELKIILDATVKLVEIKLEKISHLSIGNYSGHVLYELVTAYERAVAHSKPINIETSPTVLSSERESYCDIPIVHGELQ